MQNLFKALVIITITTLFSGCLYANVTSPLDTDVSTTRLGDKVGRSKSHSVFALVAWGDSGTASAAKNGGIETITHLDNHYYVILFGAYSYRETIAYGY